MRGNTPERSCTKLNSCLGLNPFFPLEVVSVNSLVSILPDGFYDLTCLDVQVKKRAVILCVCVCDLCGFFNLHLFIYLFWGVKTWDRTICVLFLNSTPSPVSELAAVTRCVFWNSSWGWMSIFVLPT